MVLVLDLYCPEAWGLPLWLFWEEYKKLLQVRIAIVTGPLWWVLGDNSRTVRGSSGYYTCFLVRMCFKVRLPLSGAEPREHKKGEPT